MNNLESQRQDLSKNFQKILGYLSAQNVKMNVFLQSNNFSVAVANDLYKAIAKTTFSQLTETLKNAPNLGFSPIEKQLKTYTKTNKENIYTLSGAIGQYKTNKSPQQKQQLLEAYQSSVTNMKTCIEDIHQDMDQQFQDAEQIAKIKN